MTPEQFIAAARKYLGVPWQHQGRTRFGIDCIGLLVCAAQDCGFKVGGPIAYGREPTKTELVSMIRRYCSLVPKSQQQIGDVVIMGARESHVGVLTDAFIPFGFIHVPTNGTCCEVSFDAGVCELRGTYRPKVF